MVADPHGPGPARHPGRCRLGRAHQLEDTAQRTAADALALSQKSDADSRAEWWRRAQWAFEAAMDDKPEKQDVGLAILELLNTSKLAGPEEAQIIAEAWKPPLKDGPATLDRLRPIPDNEVKDPAKEVEQ